MAGGGSRTVPVSKEEEEEEEGEGEGRGKVDIGASRTEVDMGGSEGASDDMHHHVPLGTTPISPQQIRALETLRLSADRALPVQLQSPLQSPLHAPAPTPAHVRPNAVWTGSVDGQGPVGEPDTAFLDALDGADMEALNATMDRLTAMMRDQVEH
jgi:hypothetical protein